jgi:hypothetical protein
MKYTHQKRREEWNYWRKISWKPSTTQYCACHKYKSIILFLFLFHFFESPFFAVLSNTWVDWGAREKQERDRSQVGEAVKCYKSLNFGAKFNFRFLFYVPFIGIILWPFSLDSLSINDWGNCLKFRAAHSLDWFSLPMTAFLCVYLCLNLTLFSHEVYEGTAFID